MEIMSRDLFLGTRISDSAYLLQEEEHHHCMRVTRHKLGDLILISDFKGQIHQGRITESSKDASTITIDMLYREEKARTRISIAISPTQQMDRFEWFVEKSVECGVHEIIPLHCHRTENTRIKKDRIDRIILSAAKQTQRAYIPIIHPLIEAKKYIKECHLDQKYICHCMDILDKNLAQIYTPNKDVVVMIGPSGDFTADEIDIACDSGFMPVSLGEFRLRTETAGIVATNICTQKIMN